MELKVGDKVVVVDEGSARDFAAFVRNGDTGTILEVSEEDGDYKVKMDSITRGETWYLRESSVTIMSDYE